MVAMGGNLGMEVFLDQVPLAGSLRDDTVLFSESAGRFVVTLNPENKNAFEAVFQGLPCSCIGRVTESQDFRIAGLGGTPLVSITIPKLKHAWKASFGALI
jgi:phosphoribosylformylglycinamidine synthase